MNTLRKIVFPLCRPLTILTILHLHIVHVLLRMCIYDTIWHDNKCLALQAAVGSLHPGTQPQENKINLQFLCCMPETHNLLHCKLTAWCQRNRLRNQQRIL